jgi:hypothetical protein
MKINPILVKTFQRIWKKQADTSSSLDLTSDQAECLARTLVQWKVYNELNQNNREKTQ